MKRFKSSFLVFGLFYFIALGLAQEKEPGTKIESILISKGSLLIKESLSLGEMKYGNIKFDALTIYEPGKEAQKIKGIRIEVQRSGELYSSNTAFLDLEEINNLLKSIDYMNNLILKWKNEDRGNLYTEVQYLTKGDFKIGFYQQGKDQKVFISCGSIGASTQFVKIEELQKIRNIIEAGLTELQK